MTLGVEPPKGEGRSGPPPARVPGAGALAESTAASRESNPAVRNARLIQITAAIAEAVTPEQVLEAVVEQVALALDAATAGLWLMSRDEQTAELVRSVGYKPATVELLETLNLAEPGRLPIVDALRRSEPVWLASRAEMLASYPHLAAHVSPGSAYSIACVPLVARDQTRGAVAFTFTDERPLVGDERELLLLVARYSSQAIERLRLLENERTLRAQSDSAARRLGVLSRASRAFAEASSSLQELFQSITRQVTIDYADACSVNVLAADGKTIEVVALQHRDAHAAALIQDAVGAARLEVGQGIVGKVIQSGEPVFVPTVDLRTFSKEAAAHHRALLERLAPSSVIVVPMRIGDRISGALAAMRHSGFEAFTTSDVELLDELASRAALAIETARLHQQNAQARLRAEILYDLAASVIGAEGVEDVFGAALDGIQRALGSQRCAILSYDDEGVMRFRAFRGLSREYRDTVEGHSPWLRDARSPEPVVVPDVRSEPSLAAYMPVLEREHIGALGFFPLVAGGRLLGKFMVYYAEPRVPSTSELAMATAIANHVAAAMNRFASIAELEQTVRFNEMFTGMLGHDLRNPLGAIISAAQLALRRAQGEALEKPLGRVIGSGERMARMIDQLLDFTRVRVGNGIPIQPRATELAPLLAQVIDELEAAYPGKRCQRSVAGQPPNVHCDPDRISQVFSNLIANAMQHGTDGEAVEVTVTAEEAMVRVDVHNGGAIPPELLPRLFEPMAGSDRRRGNARGLGLGLYISQQIARAHGGTLEVATSERDGTTFSVRLRKADTRDGRGASI